MRSTSCSMPLRAAAVPLLAALLIGLSHPAQAFDSGHHHDLCRAALQERSFGLTAIRVVQVQNWLVDFYSEYDENNSLGVGHAVKGMHFDDLDSRTKIRNSWQWLAANTCRSMKAAARANDPLRALTYLGISLHAVQDFYTHSNWVELHPGFAEKYRTDTWFNSDSTALTGLRTGHYPNHDPIQPTDHGDYHSGMNHDSVTRPHWGQAYVYAYVATREWVNACREWVDEVDPDFWSKMRKYSVSDDDWSKLSIDYNAQYRLAEYVSKGWFGGHNGHWKGPGSGEAAMFASVLSAWLLLPASKFQEQFTVHKRHQDVTITNIHSPPPDSLIPVIPKIPIRQRAIKLSTTKVEELPTGFFETAIDPLGWPDFFANITIGNETFVEAMQIDTANPTPSWQTIKFIPIDDREVGIFYTLYDEDSGGDNEICDINPAVRQNSIRMTFTVATHRLSGAVNGVHDVAPGVRIGGAKPDSNRAAVTFWVTEYPLIEP